MSEDRMLPPDVAARYQKRLAEIRLSMPHWGGGNHRTTPEAEQKLEESIGATVARSMAKVSSNGAVVTVPAPARCEVCGAVAQPSASGKRDEIVHDMAKHPRGEIPASQLDIKPMQRTSRERHDWQERASG